jgi:hypothetical protein
MKIIYLLSIITLLISQNNLELLSLKFNNDYINNKSIAEQWALDNNLSTKQKIFKGKQAEIQSINNGIPKYYITHNRYAAKTAGTNELWTAGILDLNISGSSMTIGMWDDAPVLDTHQEFDGRVINYDDGVASSHATHVAGTIMARGFDHDASGMAYEAILHSYDWNNDLSELATAATNGLLVSNHSYGAAAGWLWNLYEDDKWVWLGDPSINETQDYKFGFYDQESHDWDVLANNATNLLIVKSAGNDRGDDGPQQGEDYWVYENEPYLDNTPRSEDGDYDSLTGSALSKNILSVGAIEDLPWGYQNPSDILMSSFSSWGPTDDGRIKPDLVADGVALYSTDNISNDSYSVASGTSSSSPSAAGSLLLLQEHYQNLNSNQSMKANTLKALTIHTTKEAGSNPGPDYKYGWGLLDTKVAAELISYNQDNSESIKELTLNNNENITISFNSSGIVPIKATIVWNDPAGTPVAPQNNPTTSMLVNDLDIRLNKSSNNETFYPWVMQSNIEESAITGDNTVDNVEQIFLNNPTSGEYILTISHKGNLINNSQSFSLILTTSDFNNENYCNNGTNDACISECADGTNPCHPEGINLMNVRLSRNNENNFNAGEISVLAQGDIVLSEDIDLMSEYRVPGERYTIYVPDQYLGMWPDKFRAIGNAPQLAVTPVYIYNGHTYVDVIGNQEGPATFQLEIWYGNDCEVGGAPGCSEWMSRFCFAIGDINNWPESCDQDLTNDICDDCWLADPAWLYYDENTCNDSYECGEFPPLDCEYYDHCRPFTSEGTLCGEGYYDDTSSDIFGDLNGDEAVNVTDIVLLVNIIISNQDYNSNNDLNNDGSINVTDIVLLVNLIIN